MSRQSRCTRLRIRGALVAASALLALGAGACGTGGGGSSPAAARHPSPATTSVPRTTSPRATTTTTEVPATGAAPATTAPPATTTTSAVAVPPSPGAVEGPPSPGAVEGPVTSPPLPPPGPGFVPGHVTAVGDSVMIDYQDELEQDVPGITVTAVVSQGWTKGETRLRQLEASGQLGAVVVVGLATNGPVTAAQFDSMMTLLGGASRVVFVNTRVDQSWQTPNNAMLASGVAANPRAVLADWYSLAVAEPGWLYATQTHLPIDGPGASALAALVASKV